MERKRIRRSTPKRLLFLTLGCLMFAPAVFADPAPAVLGDLLVARSTTVDETAAASGLTLLSGSRIKTAEGGSAILNLGRLGRITLGPETELILEATRDDIGGKLLSGWMIVSASKGTDVAITTPDGVATSNGARGSVMRIDLTGGVTRVEAEGGAELLSGNESTRVADDEEVEMSRVVGTAIPAFSRRTLAAADEQRRALSVGDLLSASVRTSIESVTLDHTLVPPSGGGRTLQPVNGDRPLFPGPSQTVTPPPEPGECFPSQIRPQLIKAKAGCTLGFIVRLEGFAFPSQVSVRPFFTNACFRIFPGAPQMVTIPAGGAYNFQINANNCPRNAQQFAQNSLVVIESSACGTGFIQVEWATPCR